MNKAEVGKFHHETGSITSEEILLRDNVQKLREESRLEELPVRGFEELYKLRVGHILHVRSDKAAEPYEAGFFVGRGRGAESHLYRMYYLNEGGSATNPLRAPFGSATNPLRAPFFLDSSSLFPLEIDLDTFSSNYVVLASESGVGLASYAFYSPELTIFYVNDPEIKKHTRKYSVYDSTAAYLSILATVAAGFSTLASGITIFLNEPSGRRQATAAATLSSAVILTAVYEHFLTTQVFARRQLRERFNEVFAEDTPLKNFISGILREE